MPVVRIGNRKSAGQKNFLATTRGDERGIYETAKAQQAVVVDSFDVGLSDYFKTQVLWRRSSIIAN
jgi:hypothetical protein